jgi:hypothetical protein
MKSHQLIIDDEEYQELVNARNERDTLRQKGERQIVIDLIKELKRFHGQGSKPFADCLVRIAARNNITAKEII